MPAYVIAETDVTDSERYEQYKAASPTAIAAGAAAGFSSETANSSSLRATGSRRAWWCLSLKTLRPRSVGMSRRSTRRRRSSVRARRTCA